MCICMYLHSMFQPFFCDTLIRVFCVKIDLLSSSFPFRNSYNGCCCILHWMRELRRLLFDYHWQNVFLLTLKYRYQNFCCSLLVVIFYVYRVIRVRGKNEGVLLMAQNTYTHSAQACPAQIVHGHAERRHKKLTNKIVDKELETVRN